MKGGGLPLISLVLLSPLTAELLSGSSPPMEFFFPPSFLLLVGLYGSGVLVVRELSVKWQKGWPSILLMGATYGILEEGLVVKSFFDPSWMDLGILGVYGRWIGVNWVWSIWLTIYHGVVSITVPIILFNLMFPRLKHQRLITDVQLLLPIFVLVAITGVGVFLFPYSPESFHYFLAIFAMFLLSFAAYRFPMGWPKMKSEAPILPPKYFFTFGLFFTLFSLVIVYGLPEADMPAPTVIILLCLLCLGLLLAIINSAGRRYNEKVLLALAAGILMPFVFLAFIQEARGIWGMSVVGVCYLVYFFLLLVRIWREAPEITAKKIPIDSGKKL